MSQAPRAWPYPFWIAHRGAGAFVPENTLAAFRFGAAQNYQMFECDAKLSQDGVLYLMHDSSLDRTTNAKGNAATWCWGELSQLDAGSWHSTAWASEPLPTLENVMRWCIANQLTLNIEIKPIEGKEAETGAAIAALVAKVWPENLPPPLLSSFQSSSLAAAQQLHPAQNRAYLIEDWDDGCLALAKELGCLALICHHSLWNAERVHACHAQQLKAISYTVNDRATAEALIAMNTDGIITDRIDLFPPI